MKKRTPEEQFYDAMNEYFLLLNDICYLRPTDNSLPKITRDIRHLNEDLRDILEEQGDDSDIKYYLSKSEHTHRKDGRR